MKLFIKGRNIVVKQNFLDEGMVKESLQGELN